VPRLDFHARRHAGFKRTPTEISLQRRRRLQPTRWQLTSEYTCTCTIAPPTGASVTDTSARFDAINAQMPTDWTDQQSPIITLSLYRFSHAARRPHSHCHWRTQGVYANDLAAWKLFGKVPWNRTTWDGCSRSFLSMGLSVASISALLYTAKLHQFSRMTGVVVARFSYGDIANLQHVMYFRFCGWRYIFS